MLGDKLKAPISWKTNDPEISAFLDRLQGNILKGHGRNNVVFMFCQFREDAKDEARAFLRSQIRRVNPASDQLLASETFKRTHQKDTRPFVCIFLTKSGYDYFGIPLDKQPSDPAFQAGMAAAQGRLNDPPKLKWNSHIRDPHVMILVAVVGPNQAQHEATELLNSMGQIGDVGGGHSGELIGNQFFNEKGRGIENFGYVDGRSQPLVLQEDIVVEQGDTDIWPGTGREFPVDQFVVRDPGIQDNAAYGSYFVFRQLEQDVFHFKAREDKINEGFNDTAIFTNRDSAGVGRLESGTPFELRHEDPNGVPDVTNNFRFDTTPSHCPAFAHIRKVNPRTDATRGLLMIRRGITYGTRDDAKAKPGDDSVMVIPDEPEPETVLPSSGVGLLFQSYQANIANQFEATQRLANTDQNGGVDPVIGQALSAPLDWPIAYGSNETKREEFFSREGAGSPGPYVKLMGGGYFFAPSIPFLKGL